MTEDVLLSFLFCDIIVSVIKMKKTIYILISLMLVVSLCSCGSNEEPKGYETTKPLVNTTAEVPTTEPSTVKEEVSSTEPSTEIISDTEAIIPPSPPPTASPVTTEAPTEETTIGKTGEMAFSDSPDNRYIKAVADKYSVPAENLVSIYTVPQNDSNMVLEFSGEKDGSGRIIRDTSTLTAIYTIDADLNSLCASKDNSKNEYDKGEMYVMYFTVTTYIMPEFEEEL